MTSTAQHSQVVQKQFGEQAAAYLSSAVHAQGTEFALLQAELAGRAMPGSWTWVAAPVT